MSSNPKPTERLEKRLARVAREQGIDQERLRRWVSFLALCGVLERAIHEGVLGAYYLKGGAAMELRFAQRARATFARSNCIAAALPMSVMNSRRLIVLSQTETTP